MNIAYILNSTSRNGGATKAFKQMLSGLMQKGINPIVIVPNKNGAYKDLTEMGVPVFSTPFRTHTYPNNRTLREKALFLPRLVARLIINHMATRTVVNILHKYAIDIVHTNVGPVNIGFGAAQELGIPHIYHIREYGDLDFGLKYIPSNRHFHRQLDEIPLSYSICITKDIQAHHRQLGKPTSRIIYDGVHVKMDSIPKTKSHKDYFLFAGRIQSAKGVDTLLEAYGMYKSQTDNPFPLHLAGGIVDNFYMKKLSAIITKYGIESHVKFLGDCDNIKDLMLGARAIIISSPFEGFGLCLAEAMFLGCLTIGRNTTGTKEQYDNGLQMTGEEIGLRYNTTEELASLLMEVGTCPPEKYQPYIERAFRVVNTLYTQENNVNEIERFYQDIMASENNVLHTATN